MAQKTENKGSLIARKSAARLAAVQAVYQMFENDQDAASVTREFIDHRLGKPLEQYKMVLPDGVLFKNIVGGIEGRQGDLYGVIDAFLEGRDSSKSSIQANSLEPLLRSILLCGTYELLAHHDIDAPIIISDYIDVTHAFYDGGEAKLVNAALDHAKNALRDG